MFANPDEIPEAPVIEFPLSMFLSNIPSKITTPTDAETLITKSFIPHPLPDSSTGRDERIVEASGEYTIPQPA